MIRVAEGEWNPIEEYYPYILLLVGAVIGGVITLILKTVFDPDRVKEEYIEAIAKSKWAREWASKFCAGPPEIREKCIEYLSRRLAEKVAERF